MLKDAESIYPTPYAEYNIAYSYALLINAGKLADGSASNNEMAREIQKYVKKGDETIAADANYASNILAYLYYQRAWSLSYSGKILNNMTLDERESAYKDAIAKISVLPTDPYVVTSLFRARFKYATLLLNNFKGREADIQKLLKPFGTLDTNLSDNKIVSNYFKNLQHTNSPVTLAQISTEFKVFLLKLGWKL